MELYALVVEPGVGLLGLLLLILDIVAVVGVIRGGGSLAHKFLWILLIFLLPILGMILYFVYGNRQ
ncbi:PLDc N-terminal domain-containing protein [Aureliella helgolandensis]|uniref:Cardiolipin synthase N-terminal domain-containing protein n=1 Tax=Aureliella helgolandensis TaxID=2527968 RepID=A0A518G330_9BACT|nr:PLDc N-terminal domain-containing protein [Aureliella helgolandensis]QDV23003.1 hypothetical protein Q31a_12960 [Aureliella helgolandensis]